MNERELERLLDLAATIYVIGADIATHSGVAVFRVAKGSALGLHATRGGKDHGVCLRSALSFSRGDEWRAAGTILTETAEAGPILVAWEDQYLGKSPRSMAQVVAARARFLYAVELRAEQRGRRHDLHEVAVSPTAWQSRVLGRARGKVRATIKATSNERAPQIAALCGSFLRPHDDVADATCIGLHEIARHFTIDLAAIRGESWAAGERPGRR